MHTQAARLITADVVFNVQSTGRQHLHTRDGRSRPAECNVRPTKYPHRELLQSLNAKKYNMKVQWLTVHIDRPFPFLPD